jgi:CPA1 family monovalent cation:H+ antiporter
MDAFLQVLTLPALASIAWFAARCAIRLALRRPRGDAGAPVAHEERWARRRALRAGLACLESQQRYPLLQGPGPSLDRVAGEYRQRLRATHAFIASSREPLVREVRVRLRALSAERKELVRLRLAHRINDATFRSLSARVDLDELYLRRGGWPPGSGG